VTHLDGLVLARSSFHHSVNYRSVVVIGPATEVVDPVEKAAALVRFVEGLVPGRQADLRPSTPKEIAGTSVLRLPLALASAKVRTGMPVDDDEDYELAIWGGVVPIRTVFDAPLSDDRVLAGVEVPANVVALTR
jgi:nitroimidazol reductase NimA-like FMN-containing flavoprotein (pyridoxamine 5'-phosphate oxidase superfamily)